MRVPVRDSGAEGFPITSMRPRTNGIAYKGNKQLEEEPHRGNVKPESGRSLESLLGVCEHMHPWVDSDKFRVAETFPKLPEGRTFWG